MLEVMLTLTAVCIFAGFVTSLSGDTGTKKQMNVAEFGFPWLNREGDKPVYVHDLTRDGKDIDLRPGQSIQIDWRHPRDIRDVLIEGQNLPDQSDISIQWWYRIWPDNGGGGWQRLDDPYNGSWVTVKTDACKKDNRILFTFAPLSPEEQPGIERHGYDYRKTYKIRIVFNSPAQISRVQAFTSAVWQEADIRLQWKPKAGQTAPWTGEIEARNGYILSIDSSQAEKGIISLKTRYGFDDDRLSEDRGHIVFRASGWDSFSVFVDDVVREGAIYVRDIDAFVSETSRNLTFDQWSPPEDAWDGTIVEKVARMPEQSLERVMNAIAAKAPREAHLGVPNMRQEITLTASSHIELFENSLRSPGWDKDRRPWSVRILRYAFSTLAEPDFSDEGGRKTHRYLEERYLPVIHSEWETGDIKYHKSSFATMLMEGIGENEWDRKGHEPVVLLERLEIENTGKSDQTAFLWLQFSLNAAMSVREDGVIVLNTPSDCEVRKGLTPVRGRIDTNGRGDLRLVEDCKTAAVNTSNTDSNDPHPAVCYSVDLSPGEKHTVYLAVPYIELLDDNELSALVQKNHDREHNEVVSYWKSWLVERGAVYECPEPVLNDFYKTCMWHILMTTDKDPETGLYHQGAATVRYPNFANETTMVAQSLEMRGEYEEALRLMEPFIKCQSVKGLPGAFKSKEGVFYAAHPDPENDPYTAQGYNMHHGWVLWKLAEHYKYTRDRQWLESIASQLVAGCDWITRERQTTKTEEPDGTRPVEWGLAPPGDLEDVEEFLFFYSTNAYYYVGMDVVAKVLAEIGHPEAERIRKDADEYRKDILDSIRETTATTPVVRLKDGTYIPFVSPRTRVLTNRKEGWIREGLYPALHLLDGDVIEPSHPLVSWMLNDLEDNIFLSKESGYAVEDQEASFFDFGGFNLQPNLCPNATAHLRRDEISNFIRVFYNIFWASYYEDTVCFAEWVRHYGMGGGPLYKTPDEAKFIQFMRNMLILEEGEELRLGAGVPRAWMKDGQTARMEGAGTFFGEMDICISSHVSRGYIEADIRMPDRNLPENAWLRLRHPDGNPIKEVTVNGQQHSDFDPETERIELPVDQNILKVVAKF